MILNKKKIFVTGAAGFISSNLVMELLKTVTPVTIVGLDNMNDYYDVSIKECRLSEIEKLTSKHLDCTWSFVKGSIADRALIDKLFAEYKFDVVVNLAAQEGVSLLFQRGAFTAEASKMVFIGSAIYIVGQQTGVIRDLIYRYFYACGDTRIPGINSITVSILNIVISLVLVSLIGFYGIILGTVLASLISLGIILIWFKKKFGFDEKIMVIIGRYFISMSVFAATVVIVYMTKHFLPISNNLVSLFVYGAETVVIYTVLSVLFNRKTLVNFKNL